ncbi:FMN reductase [Anopheles sinensis]|uniref:FMN reductase n=1 Tax=Anopheles sinensis TaxID=74873 RepID=A0A084W4P1_ANOSI|nr:FMN reductase [Anopheles sinensis]
MASDLGKPPTEAWKEAEAEGLKSGHEPLEWTADSAVNCHTMFTNTIEHERLRTGGHINLNGPGGFVHERTDLLRPQPGGTQGFFREETQEERIPWRSDRVGPSP